MSEEQPIFPPTYNIKEIKNYLDSRLINAKDVTSIKVCDKAAQTIIRLELLIEIIEELK